MEHYGYMSCTLTLLADRLRACRENAAADLKKVRGEKGFTATNEIARILLLVSSTPPSLSPPPPSLLPALSLQIFSAAQKYDVEMKTTM